MAFVTCLPLMTVVTVLLISIETLKLANVMLDKASVLICSYEQSQ